MEDKPKTVTDLEKVLALLWDALEVGTQNVQAYFKEKHNDIDPFLSPCIMRYAIKRYITDNYWRIDGLLVNKIPNNGLSLFYNDYHLRVWKYIGKKLPSPGSSSIKNAFLRQQHFEQIRLFPINEPNTNLVLLWDVDDEYQLKGLRLSKPKFEYTGVGEIEAEWSIPLEHPVSTKDRVSTKQHTDTIYDLPYEMIMDNEEDINESGS